jgi:hypothetical protein
MTVPNENDFPTFVNEKIEIDIDIAAISRYSPFYLSCVPVWDIENE